MLNTTDNHMTESVNLPILAALIAGAFGLITLHINKKNKISEFRQAWIDGLREEIATLASLARTIASSLDQSRPNQENIEDYQNRLNLLNANNKELQKLGLNKLMHDTAPWTKAIESLVAYEDELAKESNTIMQDFRKAQYHILLRLNLGDNSKLKGEERHSQIHVALDKIIEYMDPRKLKDFDFDKSIVLIDNFILCSRRVLKEEWTRVKIGEFRYKIRRIFKRI